VLLWAVTAISCTHTRANREMMTAQKLIVAVVALSLFILLVMPGQRRQAGGGEASMLLGRGNAVANAMGRPEQLWTGTPEADGLYDNMGAANLKLSGTIQTLDASRHNPNLAAAVHSLQVSHSCGQRLQTPMSSLDGNHDSP